MALKSSEHEIASDAAAVRALPNASRDVRAIEPHHKDEEPLLNYFEIGGPIQQLLLHDHATAISAKIRIIVMLFS